MPRLTLRILPEAGSAEFGGGLRFAFFFAVVLFAAINTGNNLIYLVLATLTAIVIISWVLARLSMRGLQADLALPDEIYAGEETVLEFDVEKASSRLPARSISMRMLADVDAELHIPYLDALEGGHRIRVQGLARFRRRGHAPVKGVQVSCTWPFGLLSINRNFSFSRPILVLPQIRSMESLLRTGSEGLMQLDAVFRGLGGGLYNIRHFLPGDDNRHIHWKATAKTNEMMVQEHSRLEGKTIWLHFNPLARDQHDEASRDLFEAGVSLAASLAYHARSAGLEIICSAPGQRLIPAPGYRHITTFLQYLAGVKMSGRLVSQASSLIDRRRQDEMLIVVDPLNVDTWWGRDAIVLDREYVDALPGVQP